MDVDRRRRAGRGSCAHLPGAASTAPPGGPDLLARRGLLSASVCRRRRGPARRRPAAGRCGVRLARGKPPLGGGRARWAARSPEVLPGGDDHRPAASPSHPLRVEPRRGPGRGHHPHLRPAWDRRRAGLLPAGSHFFSPFAPLGIGGALHYSQQVLIPSLASHNSDCAYDSVRTLFTRTVGGETYQQPTGNGYIAVTSPIHLPEVALFLSYLSAILFAGGAVWAAWRSGWNPPYGMSMGFALGALIPNEVWPYQWLPLLPLILLLAVRALEQRRALTLALLGVFLLGFVRQPCELFFPNLWTLAAIAIFGLGVGGNLLFRSAG